MNLGVSAATVGAADARVSLCFSACFSSRAESSSASRKTILWPVLLLDALSTQLMGNDGRIPKSAAPYHLNFCLLHIWTAAQRWSSNLSCCRFDKKSNSTVIAMLAKLLFQTLYFGPMPDRPQHDGIIFRSILLLYAFLQIWKRYDSGVGQANPDSPA